jgi:hypothetical protein
MNGEIISFSSYFCDRHDNSSCDLLCEKEVRGRERDRARKKEREREREEKLDGTLHVLNSTAFFFLKSL